MLRPGVVRGAEGGSSSAHAPTPDWLRLRSGVVGQAVGDRSERAAGVGLRQWSADEVAPVATDGGANDNGDDAGQDNEGERPHDAALPPFSGDEGVDGCEGV